MTDSAISQDSNDMTEPPSTPSDSRGHLWHGRFDVAPDDALMAFTASLGFDQRLWAADIAGTRAHVEGLCDAGIFTPEELGEVLVALDTVSEEFASGRFEFGPGDEDIHTAIERRVTELAGASGARIHTARSRNDQVATALRLWVRCEVAAIIDGVIGLQEVLLQRSLEQRGVYLPGYTHLQRAQPVLLAHHLLAHAWSLGRDVDRLFGSLDRMNVSPLGAGALAGTSIPIDPAATATRLGFDRPFANSLDAVSDRDFVAEVLFSIALLGTHLSRIGEEWVLWTTEEFGFATLDDAYATGSSMLPQKKNADIAELLRGKTGRFIGNLTALLVTLKGLPLSYNRDLQEDKEPLFDSVDQIKLGLAAVTGMIASTSFHSEPMQAAADAEVLAATDIAEHLVRTGVPFRQAHAIVGRLVAEHLASEVPLVELVDAELGSEVAMLLQPGRSILGRRSAGAAGPAALSAQLDAFTTLLERDRVRRAGLEF